MKTIRFEDYGTGYYIITRNGRAIGRMFRSADCHWYFTDNINSNWYSYAARRFNDAKRMIRAHFASR